MNGIKVKLKAIRINIRSVSSVRQLFFRDQYMVSIFDDEHSETEDHWITLGTDENGILLVVSHTAYKISSTQWNIRIISARKATKKESTQYEESVI